MEITPLAIMDSRFSTMTEVRRVLWPEYESSQWTDPLRFQQVADSWT